MSTAEIANGMVDLCRQGKFLEAVNKYYSENIVSVESASFPGMPKEMKGIEAIRGKNKHFADTNEIHRIEANGPFLGEKQFAVEYKLDVTQKASGKRMQMDEMGLYTVDGGKIVHEHFFYNASA